MLNDFEKEAKNLMHSNNVIALTVTMTYGEPNDKKLSGKSLLKKNLPNGTKIPTWVTYSLKELQFSGASKAKRETINDTSKWDPKPNGLIKGDDIEIVTNSAYKVILILAT